MSPPFDAFAAFTKSHIITFVIGSGATEFYLHADAISRLSKPLQALINGGMREAKEGRVVWDDLDDDTFIRFTQWAYTNDYETPEPDVQHEIAPPSTQVDPVTNLSSQTEKALYCVMHKTDTARCHKCSGIPGYGAMILGNGDHNCAKCKRPFQIFRCHECHQSIKLAACLDCRARKSKTAALIRAFADSGHWSGAWTPPNFHPRQNTKASEDYTNVFLSHAKLYVLADKYDIVDLGKESLHRLHLTLQSFAVYESRMVDILCLVQFVFDNTQDIDILRSMLVLYCACLGEDLAKCPEFQSVMQTAPDFGQALVLKLAEQFD
ncbi:hypothetical protein PG988_012824 [Apiospora saccharicola]